MFNDIFIAPAYPADITLSYHMEPNEASQYVWTSSLGPTKKVSQNSNCNTNTTLENQHKIS